MNDPSPPDDSRLALKEHLDALRRDIDTTPHLDDATRTDLALLVDRVEAELAVAPDDPKPPEAAFSWEDAISRFEAAHPALGISLRNIMVTLGNMGI
ncbi:MAG: DUF4404 family protein [Candidatus Competibacterales bacterium]